MLRFAPFFLALLGLTIASLAPRHASADVGAIDLQLGGMDLETPDGQAWHPNVRVAGSLTLVGPLQAGAFVNVTAAKFPLRRPRLGGGLLLAARPNFGPIRLIAETSFGRLQLPTGQNESESVWSAAVTAGTGVEVSDSLVLEARLTHQWLLGAESLGSRSWAVLGGLSFSL